MGLKSIKQKHCLNKTLRREQDLIHFLEMEQSQKKFSVLFWHNWCL